MDTNRDMISVHYQMGKSYQELGCIECNSDGHVKQGKEYIPSEYHYIALKHYNTSRILWKTATKVDSHFNKKPILFEFDSKCVYNLIFNDIMKSFTFKSRGITSRFMNFFTGSDPEAAAANFVIDVFDLDFKGENKFIKLKDITKCLGYMMSKRALHTGYLGGIFNKIINCEEGVLIKNNAGSGIGYV